MKIGTVKELLTPARLNPALQGTGLLLIEVDTERIVAADLVGAKPGDRVVLLTGPAAASVTMRAPADAAAIAIL